MGCREFDVAGTWGMETVTPEDMGRELGGMMSTGVDLALLDCSMAASTWKEEIK
jgi:hypothetical protein